MGPIDLTGVITSYSIHYTKLYELQDESIKRIVSQTETLPSLPKVYTDVIRELQADDPSIKKVGEIISSDLGMTAKILQIVNSAFFGLVRKISNPREAVMLLGTDTIKALSYNFV